VPRMLGSSTPPSCHLIHLWPYRQLRV
jgi:hypothetical protein